ncbi:hypothetical protein O1611_g2535 [Lasiodiplodia mahajangana]|uniref:Uncharacterized protein n=1 Tax=Lasiodiplodia mahajangana TaxID=1108764 RepID=A0ACC2JU80_9PEZI|nr:hypothetical protein O1611_g2535 [Lasiodiplodia mahajangana]
MSPVAHSRTTTTRSTSAMTSYARNHTTEPVRGDSAGRATNVGNYGTRKEPFRHIDDIVSVGVDLDPHATIRKVLEAGDAHMQQAITYKAFGRPDLALQEYIKAFTIAVDKVPKHKDYPSLKSDRGDLNRRYQALKINITNNGVAYDKVKELIKEDNLRSGVRPKKTISKAPTNLLSELPSVPSNAPLQQSTNNHNIPHPNYANGNARDASTHQQPVHLGDQLHDGSGLERKPRPIVHPKPQALHGNSIKPVLDRAPPDLAARFAKLRSPQESRNKSSPPSPAKPIGPRAMPPSHRLPLSVRSSLPGMPKIPDAVYSPVRGTLTGEAASLPSSTPRGMFSRTNSVVSISGTPSRNSMESVSRTFNKEQFVAAHTYGDSQTSSVNHPDIPAGDLITVKELLRWMEDPSVSPNIRILLIDVRDRQSFDEGHIMSQSTICLDPTILTRQDISAADIADSMVLAPTSEKLAFEQRDEADLIVFYDQNSELIPQKATSDVTEMVISNLRQALVHFSFPKQLNHTPKLLVGGLDAWVDERGYQSLQTSKTQSIVSHSAASSSASRQRLANRTLKPEEVNTIEAMIERDENGDFDYAKSRDEFMRRYPSLREPESMTSNKQDGPSARSTGLGGEEFLKDITPMPPVRPKPSVARTRYSGLESPDEHMPGGFAMVAAAPNLAPPLDKPTGLINPQNWCYANASIQVLLVCRGWVDYFLEPQWPTKYRPDVDPSNPAYNQLLCKILGNLFQWLSQRTFSNMKATTLMHYLRSIYPATWQGGQVITLGDNRQHDSDEFITFLFTQLESETRLRLTRNVLPQLDETTAVGSVAGFCGRREYDSIISQYWYMVEIQTLTCRHCGVATHQSMEVDRHMFAPPADHDGTLEPLIAEHFESTLGMSECDACKNKGKDMTRQAARLPPLLRIVLNRTDQTGSTKILRPFTFPFNDLDWGKHALSLGERQQIAQILGGDAADGFDCPAKYDLIGVVLHAGATMASGHYTCYIKADDGTWTYCNDTLLEPRLPTSIVKERVYRCDGQFTPHQLYYKRQAKETT